MCIIAAPVVAGVAATAGTAAAATTAAAAAASVAAAAAATTATAATATGLAGWIGANAAVINGSLAVANAVGTEYLAYQKGRAETKAAERNSRANNVSVARQYASDTQKQIAEDEALDADLQRLERDARAVAGSAIVASVEGGAGGASIDNLLGDFSLVAGESIRNAKRSRTLSSANSLMDATALRAGATARNKSMAVNITQPSLTRFALSAGVGGLSAYSKFLPPVIK